MGFLSRSVRGRVRLIALAALITTLALTGAAKVSLAGTSTTGTLTATVTVLNDQSALILGTPTPGKNIGYDLNIANGSTNTLNHIAFTDTIGSKSTIVYINAPAGVTCSGMGGSTLSCTSTQLGAGLGFDVIVLFQTDPKGTGDIVNSLNGTYAPESQNTTNHRTDPTKTFSVSTTSPYASTAGGSFAQSLALPTDGLSAGGPGQTSSIKLPPGFLNSNNYVGTTLENLSGTGATVPPLSVCAACLHFQTKVTMPLARTYGTGGPFLDALLNGQPYTFTITIPGGLLPNGFKPSGVWHADGDGTIQLPSCALDSNNNPIPLTSAPGICVASLTQLKPSKDIIATGPAFSNGSYWIG